MKSEESVCGYIYGLERLMISGADEMELLHLYLLFYGTSLILLQILN